MLTREDIEKIADINKILLLEGDDCELEIESITWLIEKLLVFEVKITELQNDNQRLNNALDTLLGALSDAQKEKMRNARQRG